MEENDTASPFVLVSDDDNEDKVPPIPPPSRIKLLADWLSQVIGNDPDPQEMKEYAQKFFDEGLHSPQAIQELCTSEDVDGFDWMKRVHKVAFKHCANLKPLDP